MESPWQVKEWVGLATSSWVVINTENEAFYGEFPKESDAYRYIEFLDGQKMLEDLMKKYELECGCEIEPQYLPLQGGERKVTCDHGYEWLIRAQRTVETHFTNECLSRRADDD